LPFFQLSYLAVIPVKSFHEPFFAKILGKKTIDISVAAESLLPSLNAFDIALVLDRTGSMAGTNLTNLKTAATDFLNDMDDGNNDVKVSVVPFAQYVNIGLDYANQSWLDLPRNSAGGDDVTCNMEYTSNSSCFNPTAEVHQRALEPPAFLGQVRRVPGVMSPMPPMGIIVYMPQILPTFRTIKLKSARSITPLETGMGA